MFEVPILLIIYKRKDTTLKLINQLRLLKPKFLFVAADAANNDADIAKCIETRKIIDTVDWDCQIHNLYQEKNLGVALGPKVAIDWFFEQNEMGIILEDDIFPSIDFFYFCEELLHKYKDEPNVMHINAMNFHLGKNITKDDYYFSSVTCPWGWATWKRAWNKYDFFISDLEDNIKNIDLPKHYINELINYKRVLETNKNLNQLYAWDYQWLYCVAKNKALCIVPSKNLAMNTGFDSSEASNTFAIPDWAKKIKLEALKIKNYPEKIELNKWADELTFREIVWNYKANYLFWIKDKLKRFL